MPKGPYDAHKNMRTPVENEQPCIVNSTIAQIQIYIHINS